MHWMDGSDWFWMSSMMLLWIALIGVVVYVAVRAARRSDEALRLKRFRSNPQEIRGQASGSQRPVADGEKSGRSLTLANPEPPQDWRQR